MPARVAGEFVGRLLAAGTTCAGVYATSSKLSALVAFEAADRAGLLARIGLVLMDRGAPDGLLVPKERALSDMREILERYRDHERLHLAVTPRFALSCSAELLRESAAFAAENGLFVQTHLSENEKEGEATLEAFPGAADYFGVYEAAGLAGERSVFAHAIHLRRASGTASRGAEGGSLTAPTRTSSSAAGACGSARRSRAAFAWGSAATWGRGARSTCGASRRPRTTRRSRSGSPISPEALFALATWGGADALGYGAVAGALTPGRRADFVVLDVPAHARSLSDVLGHLLFASDTTKVLRTYVAGRRAA